MRFYTNLDGINAHISRLNNEWAGNTVPRIGESILISIYSHRGSPYFTLKVVDVTYSIARSIDNRHNYVSTNVELHLPNNIKSINEWTKYVENHINRTYK